MTPAQMQGRIAHLEDHLEVGALLIDRLTRECRRLRDENEALRQRMTDLGISLYGVTD